MIPPPSYGEIVEDDNAIGRDDEARRDSGLEEDVIGRKREGLHKILWRNARYLVIFFTPLLLCPIPIAFPNSVSMMVAL